MRCLSPECMKGWNDAVVILRSATKSPLTKDLVGQAECFSMEILQGPNLEGCFRMTGMPGLVRQAGGPVRTSC
mgnify:CR=1 FL=1